VELFTSVLCLVAISEKSSGRLEADDGEVVGWAWRTCTHVTIEDSAHNCRDAH
jgi:hypothetical protein